LNANGKAAGSATSQDAEAGLLIPTTGGGFDVAHALTGEGFDASEDGSGRGTPLVPVTLAFKSGQSEAAGGIFVTEEFAPTIQAQNNGSTAVPCIAFSAKDYGGDAMQDCSPTLRAGGHADSHANAGVMPAIAYEPHAFDARQADVLQYDPITGPMDTGIPGPAVPTAMQVRRLTPLETERLMGFKDGYTAITYRGKPAADGPRYKSHGNSWAVNCPTWIGERIEAVDMITAIKAATA
jgi:DNA (cytosine-5)-methyltransferase 1